MRVTPRPDTALYRALCSSRSHEATEVPIHQDENMRQKRLLSSSQGNAQVPDHTAFTPGQTGGLKPLSLAHPHPLRVPHIPPTRTSPYC